MKIFFFGPFPPPVHGMSIANATLLDGLSQRYDVSAINTASSAHIGDTKDMGHFSWVKLRGSVKSLFSGSIAPAMSR